MADKPVKKRDDEVEGNDETLNTTVDTERRPPRKPAPRGPQTRSGPRSGGDFDGGRGGPGGRRGGYFQGRRRVCPIKFEEVDWKNLDSLRYFVSDDGSMRPRRKTGANAKLQRKVAVMVKRARHMALLPYTGEHIRLANKR